MDAKPINKVLAVIRNPRFGMGDRGIVWLSFDAYVSAGLASLQILSIKDAVKLIECYEVSDVALLDGKTVWVDHGNGLMHYLEGSGI